MPSLFDRWRFRPQSTLAQAPVHYRQLVRSCHLAEFERWCSRELLSVQPIALERCPLWLDRIRRRRSSFDVPGAGRFQGCGRLPSSGLPRCARWHCAVCLQPGEVQLDWVEVRAVGRDNEELGADRFDPVAERLSLVAEQVVHDDDVARAQFGDQHPRDIDFEGHRRLIGPSNAKGPIMPSSMSPATKVEVFQWLCGCRGRAVRRRCVGRSCG